MIFNIFLIWRLQTFHGWISGSATAIICKYYDRSWIQNVAINKDDIRRCVAINEIMSGISRTKFTYSHVQYTSMWNNVAQGVWYKAAAQSTVELAEIVNTQNMPKMEVLQNHFYDHAIFTFCWYRNHIIEHTAVASKMFHKSTYLENAHTIPLSLKEFILLQHSVGMSVDIVKTWMSIRVTLEVTLRGPNWASFHHVDILAARTTVNQISNILNSWNVKVSSNSIILEVLLCPHFLLSVSVF